MTRPLVIVLLIASAVTHARAADPPRGQLNAPSISHAEKLLAELGRLDAPSASGVFTIDARRAVKIAAQVRARAEALPEGDLRIDLATAARFYERASARLLAPRAETIDDAPCAGERPGAYQRLCAASNGRNMVTLLLAKGRLHADWARALIEQHTGEGGTSVVGSLEEMRAERVLDAVLARQALVALKELEAVTDTPATLADFETERKVGTVSPADFSRRLDGAASVVEQTLAWLPESPLKCEIDNAFQSYADGFWWWQRADRPLVVRVVGNKFAEQNFAAMSHLPNSQLGYNAVVNLRHAREYARHVESLLDAELSRAGLEMKRK